MSSDTEEQIEKQPKRGTKKKTLDGRSQSSKRNVLKAIEAKKKILEEKKKLKEELSSDDETEQPVITISTKKKLKPKIIEKKESKTEQKPQPQPQTPNIVSEEKYKKLKNYMKQLEKDIIELKTKSSSPVIFKEKHNETPLASYKAKKLVPELNIQA